MSHEADQADQAQSSLRELDALSGRTRLASKSMATGYPLVGWGFAYVLGLGALDLLNGPLQIGVSALAWLIGMLLSWLPMRAVIRTGAERRMHWAWVIVLLASPFMVAAAEPASFTHAVIFLGSLWGLAMCLYAVATDDRLLAVVAGIGIVMAGVVTVAEIPSRLLWFGISAGLPLLVLGIHRVVRGLSRV